MEKTKKIFTVIIIVSLICLAGFRPQNIVLSSGDYESLSQNVLRLHIRAASNSEYDQAVKLSVRDALLDEFGPVMERYKSFDSAVKNTKDMIPGIESFVNSYLADNGISYTAKADVGISGFPDRTYDDIYFPAGEYTALKIDLGGGDGENWWCVMYPPLCFVNIHEDEDAAEIKTDNDEVEVRWWLAELIDSWF